MRAKSKNTRRRAEISEAATDLTKLGLMHPDDAQQITTRMLGGSMTEELNEESFARAVAELASFETESKLKKAKATELHILPWQLVKFFGWTVEDVASDLGMTLEAATEACKCPAS